MKCVLFLVRKVFQTCPSSMEGAFYPVLLLSKVFATFCHSPKNAVLLKIQKIYCFVVWCALTYVIVQVIQEMHILNQTETRKSENVIIRYCALVFAYFLILFNLIVCYLALFRSSKIVEIVKELNFIARSLKCKEIVSKKTKAFSMKYISALIGGTLLCLYQELATWKEELHYNNRLAVTFTSSFRMIWMEVQVTTFAYSTGILLREINTRIEVRVDSKQNNSSKFNFQNLQSGRMTSSTLERLNHLHARLRALVKSTCSTYEPTLVLTFPLGLLVNEIYSLYYISIGVWDLEEMYSDSRWDVVLGASYWAVLLAAHFYCMARTCDKTLEEV